jgi:hypothetical protein
MSKDKDRLQPVRGFARHGTADGEQAARQKAPLTPPAKPVPFHIGLRWFVWLKPHQEVRAVFNRIY